MTKLVTFNRAMRGMGNPALIDNDELIARLQAEGVIASMADWPPGTKPAEPAHKPQTYLTKAARKLKGSASAAVERPV